MKNNWRTIAEVSLAGLAFSACMFLTRPETTTEQMYKTPKNIVKLKKEDVLFVYENVLKTGDYKETKIEITPLEEAIKKGLIKKGDLVNIVEQLKISTSRDVSFAVFYDGENFAQKFYDKEKPWPENELTKFDLKNKLYFVNKIATENFVGN